MVTRILMPILLIIYFFVGACITVRMGNDELSKSTEAIWKAPSTPYVAQKNPMVDAAWVSDETKNVLAFQTECPKNYEPTQESLIKETLKLLENSEVKETTQITYNDRPTVVLLIHGNLEGVPMIMKTYLFKKNGCHFKIIYSGLSSKFESELKFFNEFTEGFKVP